MAEEVQEEEGGLRSHMWKHEAMVEWINSTEGVDLNEMSAAEIIAYAFAKRVAWRKSDVYRNLVETHAAEAEKEAAAKAAAREAAKAEKAAAAEKAKAEKAAAAKKAPAAKKAAKATKATKAAKTTKKAAASDGGDSPFD